MASLRSDQGTRGMRRQHGLWILPEVWKAPKRTGPSHTSLDGAKAPPTGSTGPSQWSMTVGYDPNEPMKTLREDTT